MTKYYQSSLPLPPVKRRKVEADFSGVDITSYAEIGLIAQFDRKMGLTRVVAHAMDDTRRSANCNHHSLPDLLRQRICGPTLSHEE